MSTILAILAGLGGILAYFFFKRGQTLSALLSLLTTKEKDLEIKQEIIKNQAAAAQEEANRNKINADADAAKAKEITGEELANDLTDLLNRK